MADYVLVHGGDASTESWNKLTTGKPVHTSNGRMGGRVWKDVKSILEGQSHLVFAPTLINEFLTNLSGHIEQIGNLITDNDLDDVILVGHSYGGMIITGVASDIPENIGRLVYLDADIPDPGQSLFDLLSASGLDPIKDIPGLDPAPAYTEGINFDPKKTKPLKKTFIRCTESEVADFVKVSTDKIAADPENWTVWDLESTHICQAAHSPELARLLLKAADYQQS